MENKLLITGLGIGEAFDVCQACNMDYSWLITSPSSLIWADQICIPKHALEAQLCFREDKHEKALGIILEQLVDAGVVKSVDIKAMYQPRVGHMLLRDMERDLRKILETYPEAIKKGPEGVPKSIVIDGYEYCGPYLASIYASLKVSNDIGAHCLFGKRDYAYLKYKMGIDYKERTHRMSISTYSEIFTFMLPNDPILPEYAITPIERCGVCTREKECSSNFIQQVEYSISNILKWRDYDEIYMVKEEISKIISKKDSIDGEDSIEEIKRELAKRQRKINAMINRRFPQIKRFTSLVTILAVPTSAYSIFTANPVATAVSSLLLAIAKGADGAMDYYKNKNKWVGFFNKN